MDTNPFGLPCTKIGLGGVRLIDMAGVEHPQSVLKEGPGMHPKTGKPYGKPPADTISSAQAAVLLGICPSSARSRLRRRKVREYYVQLPGGSLAAYWQKREVLELVGRQAAVCSAAPRGMVGWRQAVKLLGCSRTTLQRHAGKGRVRMRACSCCVRVSGKSVCFCVPGSGIRRAVPVGGWHGGHARA